MPAYPATPPPPPPPAVVAAAEVVARRFNTTPERMFGVMAHHQHDARRLLVLHLVNQGHSYEAIAPWFQRTPGAIYKLAHTAYIRLTPDDEDYLASLPPVLLTDPDPATTGVSPPVPPHHPTDPA